MYSLSSNVLVIELPSTVETADPVFGWVEHMGARYTEIITRDNKSYLIPNEDFITRQVVNWSHGDTLIRLEVKFRVSYEHNPREVKAIAEKAVAGAHERIAADHPPLCHLSEFGETGLHFRMRFWIRDAEKGVVNIRGIVMMALWDAFHEHGIKIPYPHHEIIIHKNRKRA